MMLATDHAYKDSVLAVADYACRKYYSLPDDRVHPTEQMLQHAYATICSDLPEHGRLLDGAISHIMDDICPGLSGSPSPRYHGFVTGGSTPAAQMADMITSIVDQNVQVHLPQCSVSTTVEDSALCMALDLLQLDSDNWPGRTITTGATASNLLGLICGRNYSLKHHGIDVGEDGFSGLQCQVFCASAHASIKKAASIAGIGRRNCIDLMDSNDPFGVTFDLPALETRLAHNLQNSVGSIVVASLGEVNTGLSSPNVDTLQKLCKQYNAWLHVDAAFAIFAGILRPLNKLLESLTYADSICVDGHKWLNVPYDCAMYFTKNLNILKNACASGPAAYLTSSIAAVDTTAKTIESPLNVGIENSRRFRALPLYASLVAYGRVGYSEMILRNINYARSLDAWLRASPWYEVLTPKPAKVIGQNLQENKHETTNIILFSITSHVPEKFQNADGMQRVVTAINATGSVYLTGTSFQQRACARIAVSNWRVGFGRQQNDEEHKPQTTDEDLAEVIHALTVIMEELDL